VIALAAGTLIADFTSFFLGRLSRELIIHKHPKIVGFVTTWQAQNSRWTFVLVTLYAAFVPLPNEVILIPLGLTGVSFKNLIIPLILGNLLSQLVLVYGIIGLTQVFF
jgi:membrane protein DedA with SNARE-associated domain